VSKPPEYPGSQRLKRVANRSGGAAYEGAFEAVGAILIATLLGYWFDSHYETTPTGVIVGAIIGFGAFVLRLVKMGRQLHPEDPQAGLEEGAAAIEEEAEGRETDSVSGPGVGLGLSDVFDPDGADTREGGADEKSSGRKHDGR